ncbi:hypothetical protein RFI_40142 [Reticulomyxa filosa]|uniref:Uncharacterized protein n=1 Tax=Reticulomyxa filosa TaxID=46433 RepID=X6L725_RETFI|nr:hypothetical protein RFI_40142 [Reticulomyxa filosa]|eukprot:ETN97387.1 hypothetical protein RFI_40142 [Reticulomyxa filosa]
MTICFLTNYSSLFNTAQLYSNNVIWCIYSKYLAINLEKQQYHRHGEITIKFSLKKRDGSAISQEICLHILWNILKHPKHIKYRQINYQALYNYLLSKCYQMDANFEEIFADTEELLQYFGFKKGSDNNWYYQYDEIQLLHTWKCYQALGNLQIMYVYYVALIKHMI